MNTEDTEYRKTQFKQLKKLDRKFDPAIQIASSEATTDWIFITPAELRAIIAVLMIA